MKYGRVLMGAFVRKDEERIISKGGNASLLYLPKEYFTPGEKVSTQLEIDPDGNLKMVLTKQLFNFTCDTLKSILGNNATVEYDKTIAGTRIFSATKKKITLNCTKSTRDLEPAYATISRQSQEIYSAEDYTKLLAIIRELKTDNFDAYLEPEGDIESLNIFKNPQRYSLKDEVEAIDALNETGRKIGFSIVIRFNSKKNNTEQVRSAIDKLES